MAAVDSNHLPAGVLRGRGIGIIVAALFAAAWANWSRLLLVRLPTPWPWLIAVAAIAISVMLVLAGIALVRHGRASAAADADDAGGARTTMRRRFLLVLAGEIIALNLVAFLLFRHGLPQYLGPAFAIIVGLHFFPLASTFGARHFHATAVVMTVAGVLAVLAIASGSRAVTAAGLAEIACAVTLWATAFVSWRRTRHALATGVARVTARPDRQAA